MTVLFEAWTWAWWGTWILAVATEISRLATIIVDQLGLGWGALCGGPGVTQPRLGLVEPEGTWNERGVGSCLGRAISLLPLSSPQCLLP
jgi:hypothetical protein